ncbi:MAG: hypothetical protein ACE5JP_07840 [Candidatus Bipolaricaulia bacterium]
MAWKKELIRAVKILLVGFAYAFWGALIIILLNSLGVIPRIWAIGIVIGYLILIFTLTILNLIGESVGYRLFKPFLRFRFPPSNPNGRQDR